ncbi:TPA: hypothetical protein ACFNMW_001399 [Neisseria lactamica]|uniref:hypothetical protein n=1 Tax=Neisseria lactamica TaxID=486 RepID=UPI0003009CEA|nr:hypothetical protein [Neisseria lactamica]
MHLIKMPPEIFSAVVRCCAGWDVGWASAHHLHQSLRIKGFGEPAGFGGFGFRRGMADLVGMAELVG